MILGHMIAMDEDALTCDLMETYHITNMDEYSASFVATLAVGLRDDSRIKMQLKGSKLTLEQGLLALLLDALRINNWMHTKDAPKKRNMPKSLYRQLLGLEEAGEKKYDLRHFDSLEEYEAWHKANMEK